MVDGFEPLLLPFIGVFGLESLSFGVDLGVALAPRFGVFAGYIKLVSHGWGLVLGFRPRQTYLILGVALYLGLLPLLPLTLHVLINVLVYVHVHVISGLSHFGVGIGRSSSLGFRGFGRLLGGLSCGIDSERFLMLSQLALEMGDVLLQGRFVVGAEQGLGLALLGGRADRIEVDFAQIGARDPATVTELVKAPQKLGSSQRTTRRCP